MSMHVHRLDGCTPTPLAHYLKALGILRLVSEQVDSGARGWWQDEVFHLATCCAELDCSSALDDFFLARYRPTPILAPWNGGSGFYPKDKKDGIEALASSTSPRFEAYRDAIGVAGTVLAIRAEPAKKEEKSALIRQFRRLWRGGALEALDAAIVISGEGDPRYPSLLGSGWNDGRLDFSNNFMQRLADLFDCGSPQGVAREGAPDLLAHALRGVATRGLLSKKAIGQFMPVAAGGANADTGPEGHSLVNPWDYILMLEGAVMFVLAATRRMGSSARSEASAPFAIHASSVGYASASKDEKSSRGEQWMPLWNQPATLPELRRLMAEGRVQLGRSPATRPLEFARALARLGVARGITSFQRFGYLERNGQANLAVPLGRWEVQHRKNQELLDDLDRYDWLNRLQRAARDKLAPTSLSSAHRALEAALMAVCAEGRDMFRWQAVLLALADVEATMIRGGTFTARMRLQPVPPLSGGWVRAGYDGSVEYRLALSAALQGADEWGSDPVRHHWMPLEEGKRMVFVTDSDGLRHDPRMVCHGTEASRDFIALVRRRMVEGVNGSMSRLPLQGMPGQEAHPADIRDFLSLDLDMEKLGALTRIFMALDRGSGIPELQVDRQGDRSGHPPPLYGLFRLLHLPWALRRGETETFIRCDPAVFSSLAGGDLSTAGAAALRRLTASGLRPVLRHVAGGAAFSRRLAASLAFPVSPRLATRLADQLTKPETANEKGNEE